MNDSHEGTAYLPGCPLPRTQCFPGQSAGWIWLPLIAGSREVNTVYRLENGTRCLLRNLDRKRRAGATASPGRLCPALSFRYALAPIVWLPWHPDGPCSPPCSEKAFSHFSSRTAQHKQCWTVGIRPPGSHWFHPAFVISPETAGTRGGVCNGHGWNAERSERLGSPLFIWHDHVTLPRPFCNWSPCSSFYFA